MAKGSASFLHPAPLVVQPHIELEGEWAPYDVPDFSDELVGLDGLGRPRIVLLNSGDERWERPYTLFDWWQDGVEVIGLHGHEAAIHRYRRREGRVVHRVSARGGDVEVQRVIWAGDLPVRTEGGAVGVDGRLRASAQTATYDAAGRPGVIRRAYTVLREAGPVPADEAGIALLVASALKHAATLQTADITWDGRILRPTALPEDPSTLVEPLAIALCNAIAAAVGEAAQIEPFCVDVTQRLDGPRLPPIVYIGGRAFRDQVRSSSGYDQQAIVDLRNGVASGDVVFDDLVDRLDEPALEACRALSTASGRGSRRDDFDAVVAVVRSLGDRLAALLFEQEWAGTADPFLPLVHVTYFSGSGGMALAFRRAVDGAGREHVERFLASIASTAERPDADRLGPQLAAARTDRVALAGLLSQHGLAAHAERLAFEFAQIGLQVLPATHGEARSRLGGPALLPRGEGWPMLRPGRPLSFLAGLDLAEVRAAGGDDRLPGEGWLLFFADLDNDEDGLIDCAPNEEGMPARVLFVPAGQSPVEVAVPAELIGRDGFVLNPRPVVFDPCLTLIADYEATDRLGLDEYEAESWDEVQEVLASGRPASDWPVPAAHELDDLLRTAAHEAAGQAGWVEEDWTQEATEEGWTQEATDLEFAEGAEGAGGGFLYDIFIGEGSPAEGVEAAAPDFDPVAWIGQLDDDDDEDDDEDEDDVLDRRDEPSPPSRTFAATHWVGGLVTGVQGHPPEDGTVLLPHLGFDHELGFEFLDNGAIQFRIPADALAAHDWSQVTAEADSG